MKARLILVAGKADKGEVRLKLPTIIGRTREAGLMIAHKTVSRRHCELFERHGMLYVRDSGSLNGTLVDDAPIKESMLKPGHTVTVGPLTFRAEYEPASAELDNDSPEESINGTSATATGATGVSETNRTAAMDSFDDELNLDPGTAEQPGLAAPASAAQADAVEEMVDFGEADAVDDLALDFGGDETLSLPVMEETTDLQGLESPASSSELESMDFGALEASPTPSTDVSDSLSTEDDLGLDFSLDELDPAPTEAVHVESSDDLALDFGEEFSLESPEMASPEAVAEVASVEPAADDPGDFDLEVSDDFSLEMGGDAGNIDDQLPVGDKSDETSFDFLSDGAPAAATPSAGAPSADAVEPPSAEDDFSFASDSDDLDFGLADESPAAAAGEETDLAFELEDIGAPPPPAAAPAPAAAGEEDAFDLSDDGMTFDLADASDEPEKPADEPKTAKKESKPAAAKKAPAEDDDEMSDFLKELGM